MIHPAARHGMGMRLASSHEETKGRGKQWHMAHGTGPAAHEPALISVTRPRACRIILPAPLILLSLQQPDSLSFGKKVYSFFSLLL